MRQPLGAGLEGLRPGQHLSWSYGTASEFRRGLARFVDEGLARGERVVCHVAADRLDDIAAALQDDVPSAGPAQASGALSMLSARDTYLIGGRFEPEHRLADVEELTHRALADGYSALRSLLQVLDMKSNEGAVRAWPSSELRSDFVVSRNPTTLVCAYDATICVGGTSRVLRAVHPIRSGCYTDEPGFGLHAGRLGELSLRGEIDLLDADMVGTLGSIAAADTTQPIIDVTRLRFADVSGMRALRRIVDAMQDAHGRAHIRGAGPSFLRIWRLLDMDRDTTVSFLPCHEAIRPGTSPRRSTGIR